MSKSTRMPALTIALAAVVVIPAITDVAVLADFTSVIALLGLPCGEVISARRQADNDNLVTCKDGNHYRVYINAEGRVVAQKP